MGSRRQPRRRRRRPCSEALLTTWAGWQTIFWVNGPIGAVALVVALQGAAAQPVRPCRPRAVRPARRGHRSRRPDGADVRPRRDRDQRLAVRTHPRRVEPCRCCCSPAFVVIERRSARPLVPPHTWKVTSLVSGTAVMLGITGLLVGAVFLTSIFLQSVMGYSALRTGIAFLPFAVSHHRRNARRPSSARPRLTSQHRHHRAHRHRGRGPAAVTSPRVTPTTPPICFPAWCCSASASEWCSSRSRSAPWPASRRSTPDWPAAS